MKQTDRFLIAIIAGVITLVIVALALALTRAPQGYLPDTTPGGVAHNYVLAMKQRDDERAYGYLSPELMGYPATLDAFAAETERYSWEFNRDSATLAVSDERVTGERAVVTMNETRFSENGLFGSNQYTTSFNVTLRRQGEAWKIVSADSYWSACWTSDQPCQ
jgi:hypothetical protein